MVVRGHKDKVNVKISQGNSKLGKIPSVSLPAGLTCRGDCECRTKCYAMRLERLRPSVREAYRHNYNLLTSNQNTYWREVEASIMMSRFFRFHVSGDIPDEQYLENMVVVAHRNPHCEILCFTKKYSIINKFLKTNVLPNNLHLILSAWKGLLMENPFELPEAHVRYRDGSTTAGPNAHECSGNCSECAVTDGGCWKLKRGEQVIFNEH